MKNSPKSLILSKGLKPKKSFGQNFMLDQSVNQKIARAIEELFGKNHVAIEIGAGTGSLTANLLSVCKEVHAIERDRDLIPILKESFSDENLVIHEENGVAFRLDQILSPDRKGILIGNLPYHLTSSILLKTLENHALLLGAIFLVQKEVALRIISKPHSKEYGLFSVLLQLFFDIRIISHVSKESFWPVPKVDSSIIALKSKPSVLAYEDINPFLVFVKNIFQKRRKKLSTILGKEYLPLFSNLNIDPNLRPEDLKPEQFLAIFKVNLV